MKTLKELDFRDYELIIFDWDGTLVDSSSAYEMWDKLYIEKFYNVEMPLEYFRELTARIKKVDPGRSEDEYFRYLDKQFGDGNVPIEEIWRNIYSLAPEIQSKITYKQHAADLLKRLRLTTNAYIALATNSEQRDIAFFSSMESATARFVSPKEYFDKIITLNDIDNPKPDPESFQRIIDHFFVDASKVLIFEDSVHGVIAAKKTGADVVLFDDEDLNLSEAIEIADYTFNNWKEIIDLLFEDSTVK
jgi:HAD superfamily hydrolase (TIGR01509 family)